MKDYLFIYNKTGEMFFVECDGSVLDAWAIVYDNFDRIAVDIDYIDCYTVEEAEILGYDTY